MCIVKDSYIKVDLSAFVPKSLGFARVDENDCARVLSGASELDPDPLTIEREVVEVHVHSNAAFVFLVPTDHAVASKAF